MKRERFFSAIVMENYFDGLEWPSHGASNAYSDHAFKNMKTREVRPGLFYSYLQGDRGVHIIAVWWDPNK